MSEERARYPTGVATLTACFAVAASMGLEELGVNGADNTILSFALAIEAVKGLLAPNYRNPFGRSRSNPSP